MSIKRKIQLFLAPLWQYLNQPMFDNQSVWDLKYFWYLHRVRLLHQCWAKEYSQKSSPH